MGTVSILLASDRTLFRSGVRLELELELELEPDLMVIDEASCSSQAVEKVSALHPDVAVVDVQIENESGMRLAAGLASSHDVAGVVALAPHDWDAYLAAAWEAGVSAVVTETAQVEDLVNAVHTAARGQLCYRRDEIVRIHLWRRDMEPLVSCLTPREREVVVLISKGSTNAEIAGQLIVDLKTVESHVHNILSKMGVRSKRQLAAWIAKSHALCYVTRSRRPH